MDLNEFELIGSAEPAEACTHSVSFEYTTSLSFTATVLMSPMREAWRLAQGPPQKPMCAHSAQCAEPSHSCPGRKQADSHWRPYRKPAEAICQEHGWVSEVQWCFYVLFPSAISHVTAMQQLFLRGLGCVVCGWHV